VNCQKILQPLSIFESLNNMYPNLILPIQCSNI